MTTTSEKWGVYASDRYGTRITSVMPTQRAAELEAERLGLSTATAVAANAGNGIAYSVRRLVRQ